jgi:hypothetical protein
VRQYHKDGTLPDDGYSIWVFGSNLGGRHGGGAAKVAADTFGAKWGKEGAIGHHGWSYAIPTKNEDITAALPLHQIRIHVHYFIRYAKTHPELNFWVTAVGCGLAGLDPQMMAMMFWDAPANCSLPDIWKEWLG